MVDTVSIDDLGLTPRQMEVIAAVYSDGHTLATVAGWWRVSPSTVRDVLRQAKRTLAARGFSMPRPYGRGSRAAVRELLPGVA